MKKRHLSLPIECGEKTCASQKGKFCEFLYVERFGTTPFCKLFSEQLRIKGHVPLEEVDGWLQRHPRCLELESKLEALPLENFSDKNIRLFGNELSLTGALFSSNEEGYICLFPTQKAPPNIAVMPLDIEEWKHLLKQLDTQEVEVIQTASDGTVTKAILRKSQRLIEQRVSWSVFRRDSYRCRYCGATGVPLTVDHLVLWEEGGPSTEDNLLTACRPCNKTRGNLPYEEWLKHPYYLEKARNGLSRGQQCALAAIVPRLKDIERRVSKRSTRK